MTATKQTTNKKLNEATNKMNIENKIFKQQTLDNLINNVLYFHFYNKTENKKPATKQNKKFKNDKAKTYYANYIMFEKNYNKAKQQKNIRVADSFKTEMDYYLKLFLHFNQ